MLVDAGGKVSLKIPHRRDLNIPLDHDNGQKLVEKLNQLIAIEKAWELERVKNFEIAEKARDKARTDFSHVPR